MSADLIARLRAHPDEAVRHWEDWAQEADTLMREAASALEAAEARIASVRDESVEECARVADEHNRTAARQYREAKIDLFASRGLTAKAIAEDIRALRAPPAPKQEGPHLPAAEKPERRGGHG